MDDSRIQQLTEEVLSQLAGPKDPVTGDLEARVVALEHAVRALQTAPAVATSVATAAARPVLAVLVHPSHRLVDVSSGSSHGRCVLEPDRPCVQSGQCRALGH